MRFRRPPDPMNKGPGKVRTAASKEMAQRSTATADLEISIASASSPDAGPRLVARRRGLVRLALFGACRPVRGVASSTARTVTRVTAGALDMGYAPR